MQATRTVALSLLALSACFAPTEHLEGDASEPVADAQVSRDGSVGGSRDAATPDGHTPDADAAPTPTCKSPKTYYRDADGDDRGDPNDRVTDCKAPTGYVDNGTDTQPLCKNDDGDGCNPDVLRCTPDGQPHQRQVCMADAEGCPRWQDAEACPSDAPRCDGSDQATCKPCGDSSHCEGFADAQACDIQAGGCVECTADDASACGEDADGDAFACNSLTHACSEFPAESRGVCQSCDADENCRGGRFCVDMNFQGEPLGAFCLAEAAPSCEQPQALFFNDRASRSDKSLRTFCGIEEGLATCPAVKALVKNATCAEDADCPHGGLCRQVGALPGRCSYECTVPDQCIDPTLSAPRSTCGNSYNGGEGPTYCGGAPPSDP